MCRTKYQLFDYFPSEQDQLAEALTFLDGVQQMME